MDVTFFARGLAIGFAIAAPVGAIALLCIRRTLADGRLVGFVSGLGAATADAFYGAVAALGLTAISSAIVANQSTVRLVGGVFLCYLGARTALSHPAVTANPVAARGLAGAFGSTLALTLTNPTTILSFAAVGFFRRALTPARLRWVNRLSGALLVGFGVLSLLSLAR